MSTTITRRAALTGTAAGAAAIVAGTLPAIAVAADHPDAELFALGRQYDAIYAKMRAAERRIDLVAPPSPRPIEPDALKVRPGDEALGMPRPFKYAGDCDTYDRREVDQLRNEVHLRPYYGPIKLADAEFADFRELADAALTYIAAHKEPWPEAQARADEIVSAYDAHMAERNRPEYGSEEVAEIEKEIDGYYHELRPVGRAIVATRAVTVDGLLVKARAVRWTYRDDPDQLLDESDGPDDELLRSITADLWAMQEGLS